MGGLNRTAEDKENTWHIKAFLQPGQTEDHRVHSTMFASRQHVSGSRHSVIEILISFVNRLHDSGLPRHSLPA
jgi:hypothetical protein